jgi:putative radical SAM enzyme (TIGR03279 family)
VTEVRRTSQYRKPNAGGLIDSVRPGSLGDELGLRPGDRIVAIGGKRLQDAVDFQFYAAEPGIALEVERDGKRAVYEIEKHPDDDLGLGFQDAAFDGVRICNNSCFFCFLKGNPKGLRKTLYVKDDDYRLSFVHGNFVTLTNLAEADWDRLEEQRLSPLNISVHATEPALRRYMLGNKAAPDIREQLRRLGAIGIEAHTQVVLCPGVNDGDALRRTIDDLSALHPIVRTISVVPVGATSTASERIAAGRHADEVDGCTPEHARAVLDLVAPYQRRFRREFGVTLVHLADEYYLAAGERLPSARHYDGFPQFENGIGMARSLLDDWRRLRRALDRRPMKVAGAIRHIALACGSLAAPLLHEIALEFEAATGVRVSVHSIDNDFFGPRVNVSGLLVGRDFAAQLRGREVGDMAILPRYALDYTGSRFLDDETPVELQRRLGVPIAFASTMREVLNFVGQPLESPVSGARVAATTNGKAWVEFEKQKGGALAATGKGIT